MSKWILSADLGQSVDPTAIAILQAFSREEIARATGDVSKLPPDWENKKAQPGQNWLKDPHTLARVDVRHLERLPLGTKYTSVLEIVAGLLRRPPLGSKTDFLLDATGVGRPVVDMFRRAGLKPKGVTITAGDSESDQGSDDYRVSKLILVSRLQALLHADELWISSKMKEAKTLGEELQDFRAIYSETTGYARFGAREGKHDDLVLAVAIGTWWAARWGRAAWAPVNLVY
jgi:hypothetical protein